jgi:hypothetical protein
MRRLNLRIDTLALHTIWCVLLLAASANAANLTVMSSGGGNYTTIQSCASAMSPGDTCTVYAGTYNENVTVPAGTSGNYKTITVNGSDVVSVLGFTLNSHTKLIGNCPTLQGTVTTANCGFFISNPSSPSSTACVAMPNNTTDVYIRNNVMYACGSGAMIAAGYPETVSYVYVQGNTLSYACITQAQAGTATKECNAAYIEGSHVLVEGNDMSHYTLGLFMNTQYGVFRSNNMHDQHETEAGGNSHTDFWFSNPGVATYPVKFNVIESNYQYNTFGPDAKGILAQNASGTQSCCDHIIERFNTASRLGGGFNSVNQPDLTWPYVKVYNNTLVDVSLDASVSLQGDIDNVENSTNAAMLNQLYYLTGPVNLTGFNMYACANAGTNPPASANCTNGYSLSYCSGIICSTVYGHTYEVGTWLGESHDQIADPLFVKYVSQGSLSNDYHLQAGSPAIAAGTSLTTVASGDSGSGTSLVVADASFFQDGYGLSNPYSTVQGDCVAVTTVTNHVCVTSVNYATNTLTLASSITRSSGDSVWLYSKSDGVQVLTGSAPDLGAYPYGSGGSTHPPAPPSGLAAVVQ